MKSTRDRILQTLLDAPRSTINDLADAVGINAISVRHHLTSLEAENLITTEEERHGVGRPRRVYLLSEMGLERFPSRYLRLTDHLLSQLKETIPDAVIKTLMERIALSLISQYDIKPQTMNVERRLELLKNILAEEGFSINVEKQGQDFILREVSCPYLHIGQNHPEICAVDQALISQILALPVEKTTCVLNGDSHCSYYVTSNKPVEEKP
jgi:DeoR family transcriptional regulator, suf operon transcriptional repressor